MTMNSNTTPTALPAPLAQVEAETTIRSLRMTKNTHAQLNSFKTTGGFKNLDEALTALLSAYSMRDIKELMPTREAEIAECEVLLHRFLEIYIHSLSLYHGAKDEATRRVSGQLAAKDATIAQLTIDLDTLKATSAKREKELMDEKASLEADIRRLNSERDAIATELETLKAAQKYDVDLTARLDEMQKQLTAALAKKE